MSIKQKAMSSLSFNIMKVIMGIKKRKRNITKEIIHANPQMGDTVLDFGCGPGFNTIPAARIVGKTGLVYAMDVSMDAINLVKKKAAKEELTNVKTIHSDGSTGLDNQSVDIIYLHNVFPMIKDKESAINEIRRILKTGGRLSITTGKMARRAGWDTMSDVELLQLLQHKYNFKLCYNHNDHYILRK